MLEATQGTDGCRAWALHCDSCDRWVYSAAGMASTVLYSARVEGWVIGEQIRCPSCAAGAVIR